MALDTARMARDILGARASWTRPRHPPHDEPRDGQYLRGTHDIHTRSSAVNITGLDAFGI